VAKTDDRPIDVGLAALKGKDEPTLVEWWKARFGMIAAIPQDIARVGALTPQLRELTRIADDAERRKLTRARMIAFSQLPTEQQRLVLAAREKAWEVDKAVLEKDQQLVDELAPTLDASVRQGYPKA
jgi:hypothetical protein